MTIKNLKLDVPAITPVPEGVHRPFWSVMIPNYNCTHYLVETLKSVLEQDPGSEEMQIEVVDDCSTKDNPESVVREIGKGRVAFFRQRQNMGAIANFNTCIQRARGQWVHILHSDDLVVSGFYERLREAAEKAPMIGAAFCRHIYINEKGQWQWLSDLERNTPGILSGWLERIAVAQRIPTPSIVVKRSVYEDMGGYHLELFHAADWEMWRRIAAYYPVWYEPQPLAYYRMHSESDTHRLSKSGANIANLYRSIEITESYLPSPIAAELSNQARHNRAMDAINLVRQRLAIGDIDAAIALTWESLKCSDSPMVMESLVSLMRSIDSEHFLVSLYKYAAQNQENKTIQSGLAMLQQILQEKPLNVENLSPKIIIDGVFFQLSRTGITRVWNSLLGEWINTGFAQHIIVLDRAGTMPKISNIRYRWVPPYDYNNIPADREMLQKVCDEETADLFISTYYTTPISTPSVFMAYDMIPETLGGDLNQPMWREKHYAIQQASAYITISENTARDLKKFFPHISTKSIKVAPCGVKNTFFPESLAEVNSFRKRYGISKPYFIIVGAGGGYKNTILFFRAFAQLCSRGGFDIVSTGSGFLLDADFRNYTSGSTVHMLQLSDEELRAAYSGAIALVYPSKYEGFGLPVLEALACGCPVITCPNASIPEVAEKAAIYVNDSDINGLVEALCDVQKPEVRQSLITAGLEQAKKFSWSKMAEQVSYALIDATLAPLKLREINLIIFPEWSQPEESLCADLQQVIEAIATHQNSSQMTLLIDIGNISMEDAALILSSVSMNLLLQEELDISEGPEISLIGELSEIQWEALLPRIHARIVLESEGQSSLIESRDKNIPSYKLDSFSSKQLHELKAGFWELKGHSEVAHFIRGISLRKQGKLAEAMNSYQKALEINHDFPEALQQLNITCYENHVRLKGYQFTQDWFSWNIPIWQQYLRHFINIPSLNILEIGSWEGRSTCWLLDNIMTHDSDRITCIDTFEGSVEHNAFDSKYIQTIEERFDFNIFKTGVPEKVKKIVGKSNEVMRNLPLNHYDIIYINGSHIASDVLEDAVLAWQLIKDGGYMIFDDYPFTFTQNSTWNTKIGVDAFITTFSDRLRVIHKSYQVIIEKLSLEKMFDC